MRPPPARAVIPLASWSSLVVADDLDTRPRRARRRSGRCRRRITSPASAESSPRGAVLGYPAAYALTRCVELIRDNVTPPTEVWTAYATGLLDTTTWSARPRRTETHAASLLRAATLGRSTDARTAAADPIRIQDRGEEAKRAHWRGLNADGTTAASRGCRGWHIAACLPGHRPCVTISRPFGRAVRCRSHC
jgi:hypothetical protein